MKKLWKLVVVWILMPTVLLAAIPFSAVAEDYVPIAPGDSVEVVLDGVNTTGASFVFVPSETGVYRFYSSDGGDTRCWIYDAERVEINYSDDENNTAQFDAYTYMTAGETYYLIAQFFNREQDGAFTVCLEAATEAERLILNDGNPLVDRIGAKVTVDYVTEPEQAGDEKVVWVSDDSDIASVNSNGMVSFVGVGTTTVRATYPSGATGSVEVTCVAADPIVCDEVETVTDDAFTVASYAFTAPEKGDYVFWAKGADVRLNGCLYSAGMGSVCTDYNSERNDVYLQCSLDQGDTYYFVIYREGSETEYTYQVGVGRATAATGITVSPSSLTGQKYGDAALLVDFVPNNAIREAVTWQSADEAIVAVDENGNVDFHAVGQTEITVTSESGLTATVPVTVNAPPSINRCETVEASISANGYAILFFTPEESGKYAFGSYSESDTYGAIFTADGETQLAWDDDGGESTNFLVEAELTAGETYMLKARFYSNATTGSIPVRVIRLDDDGNEMHIQLQISYDQDGHSIICDGCGVISEGDHEYDELDTCICGYSHTHTVETISYYDRSGHYGYCTECGDYVDDLHSYGEDGTCVCGYFEHDCEPDADGWKYDETGHWGYCAVCELYNSDLHSYGEDGTCICGYFLHEHVGEIAWSAVKHYTGCELCGVALDDGERHTYDEDGVCSCGRERAEGVYFGATLLSDGEYLTNGGDVVGEKPDGGYAHLSDGVLTLHQFTYSGDGKENPFDEPSSMYSEIALQIVLEGENTIDCFYGDGIYVVNAPLAVGGDGSLYVKTNSDFDGIDIDGGGLTVNGGVFCIEALDHGIEVCGDLLINDGVFLVEAGDDGMDIDGDIEINGGVFDIDAEDNGIDGYNDITINGGDFYIYTHDDNGLDANGGDITINGGLFEFCTNDEGIYSEYTVYLNGGLFAFDAGSTDSAIEAYVDIKLGEGFEHYGVLWQEGLYDVLADENGIALQDGYVTAQDDDTVQIEKSWIDVSWDTMTVSLTDVDGNALVEDEDYTVEWSAKKLPEYGLVYVTVSGVGEYSGIRVVSLKIEEDAVYVGGVKLTDGDYLDLDGDVTAEKPDGGYAFYKDGVVTLSDYSYEGKGYVYDAAGPWYSSLYCPTDTTLRLIGENSLVNTYIYGDAVTAQAALTVTGTGSLYVSADYGIYCKGDLTIRSGNIEVEGAYGIYVDDMLRINGGNVSVCGEKNGIAAYGGFALGEAMQLVTPQGGRLLKTEDGYYIIADADGNTAYEFVLQVTPVDLNGDGEMNTMDAMALFYHVNAVRLLADEQLDAADLNSDGTINLYDAARLFYMVNGLL